MGNNPILNQWFMYPFIPQLLFPIPLAQLTKFRSSNLSTIPFQLHSSILSLFPNIRLLVYHHVHYLLDINAFKLHSQFNTLDISITTSYSSIFPPFKLTFLPNQLTHNSSRCHCTRLLNVEQSSCQAARQCLGKILGFLHL